MSDEKPDKAATPVDPPEPVEAAQPDASQAEAPQVEPPQVEEPQAEPPQAEAAQPEAPQPESPTPMPKQRTPNLALRRLKAGFKPSRGQAIVAVVLALVACVAGVQVRGNPADDGDQNARPQDLIAILHGPRQNTPPLGSEITELGGGEDPLSSSAAQGQ